MDPREAHRRARQLWARLPTQRIGQQLEPLVQAHVELVRKTIAAYPPAETAYCLALSPQQYDEEVDNVHYAYGLQTDREQQLAENDTEDLWNAGLFNHFIDAIELKPSIEYPLRVQLNKEQHVVYFDYWLFCESRPPTQRPERRPRRQHPRLRLLLLRQLDLRRLPARTCL